MRRGRYSFILTTAVLGIFSMVLMGCEGTPNSYIPEDYYFWESMGSPGVGWGTRFAMAIDPSDNKPVLVFKHYMADSTRPHVMKWSAGTTWTDLGFPGTGVGEYPSITIDPSDNKPVVAFRNVPKDNVQVMKWSNGTTWADLGFTSKKGSSAPAITIDPLDNKPVVAFRDFAGHDISAYIHAKKWSSGTTWIGLGWIGQIILNR